MIHRLDAEDSSHAERPEHRLWEWWPILVLLLALLACEWVGRQWVGLP